MAKSWYVMFMSDISWFILTVFAVVMAVFYQKLKNQIAALHKNVSQLQAEVQQQKDRIHALSAQSPPQLSEAETEKSAQSTLSSAANVPLAPPLAATRGANKSLTPPNDAVSVTPPIQPTSAIEPDEQSLPIVTSIVNSIKNWFFGGNLVVRVGVLVLLVGVVLLLRLLSDYIEISIASKLITIGIAGLGLAGLGLKLVKKRFAYGITLQGAGLAIAYLSTFFAYSAYQVLASLPSFIGLGMLSALTIGLAVRQNALPLALLALSGGFFAPLLTSTETGSLPVLFSYYLLLNLTIAIIAHYRPWKALNILGVAVTFGLAYWLGGAETIENIIAERAALVGLVALHLALYVFVVIRYAQQITAYNRDNEKPLNKPVSKLYLFPIDTGLLFSVPMLAFGLFAALLHDIEHALTLTSTLLAALYLGFGWVFIRRSQRYALITEGMLALGFGFLAVTIVLAFDTQWIAAGWSVQALALVWFGRRSLRAWTVLFGLLLQVISAITLIFGLLLFSRYYPTLALTMSAISCLASVFILRRDHSPIAVPTTRNEEYLLNNKQAFNEPSSLNNNHNVAAIAQALGVSDPAARQWLASINTASRAFGIVWQNALFINILTLSAIGWALYILVRNSDKWLASAHLATTMLIAIATLVSLTVYWLINRYRSWTEIRIFSRGLLFIFYAMLILQLPQKYEFHQQWLVSQWVIFAALLFGWVIIGQLWLKTWHSRASLSRYDMASWLTTGILVLMAALHYQLPDSKGVLSVLIAVALMLAGLYCSYRSEQQTTPLYRLSGFKWFNSYDALIGSAWVFVPLTLLWLALSNWTYDGVIWGLPYLPLLNLYDVSLWLILMYGFSVFYLTQRADKAQPVLTSPILNTPQKLNKPFRSQPLFIVLSLLSFWVLSSMLTRTLHAFIGTPLWNSGAWQSEQLQTGLTILWTLIALIATIIASRHGQRTLWFMGIGLLAVVVFKLVLVDLSQTEAIWRVVSFLVAGSLILLMGYLAPLPPDKLTHTPELKP